MSKRKKTIAEKFWSLMTGTDVVIVNVQQERECTNAERDKDTSKRIRITREDAEGRQQLLE